MRDPIEFYAKVRSNIEEFGQHVQGVFPNPEEGTPAFCYTIGNHEQGLPEIMCLGVVGQGVATVLNYFGELQRERASPLLVGEVFTMTEQGIVRIVEPPADAKDEYTIQAGRYYDTEEYDVVVLVMTDTHGRWPEDPGCEEPFASQPKLKQRFN